MTTTIPTTDYWDEEEGCQKSRLCTSEEIAEINERKAVALTSLEVTDEDISSKIDSLQIQLDFLRSQISSKSTQILK